MKATLDRYFHISERGSTIGTELRAGTVSFFAMAYIILLNPLILGTSPDRDGVVLGIPQVAAATALPTPPAAIKYSEARMSFPGAPWCNSSRGSGSMPSSKTLVAARSLAAAAMPDTRAGPACSTGVVTIAIPDDAAAAEETKTYGRCFFMSFHTGFEVFDSNTAV